MARSPDDLELRFPGAGPLRWGLLAAYLLTFFGAAVVGAGYLVITASRAAQPLHGALYTAAGCALGYAALWLIPRIYRTGSYLVDARHLRFYQPHRTYRIPWDAVLAVELGVDLRVRADDYHRQSLEAPILIIETAGKTHRFPLTATSSASLVRLMRRVAGAERPREAVLEQLARSGRPRPVVRRVIAAGWQLAWLCGAAAAVVHAALRGQG